MAEPTQLGDAVTFGKFAWDVYRLGWVNDLIHSKQYEELGRDVKRLAENLDILSHVVTKAEHSLYQAGVSKPLRWDPLSLNEIIGDYEETLIKCCRLIEENRRFAFRSPRSLGWTFAVAPAAIRLQSTVALHNFKILHALKPFEIDLLCRVREDVHLAQQGLAQRISTVPVDLNRLIGVLVPDLDQAIAQRHQKSAELEIPPSVVEAFERTWPLGLPRNLDSGPRLQETAHAFVLHYSKSTINFTAGALYENRFPKLEQYVSLLKCVWTMRCIRKLSDLGQSSKSLSHWPSYIQELEDGLASQCDRFGQDLIKPSLAGLTPEMLDIWPTKVTAQLTEELKNEVPMEQILDVQMQVAASNIQRRLQLFRQLEYKGKHFRLRISAAEQGSAKSKGHPKSMLETIDFDITSVILNPLYAMPSKPGALDVMLRKDERIAQLSFTQLKDIVKFQQAVTGFKAFDSYIQYNTIVSFVVSGEKEPVVEEACVQLWIPKQLNGELVTGNEYSPVEHDIAPEFLSVSAVSSTLGTAPIQSTLRRFWDTPRPFAAISTMLPAETAPLSLGGSPQSIVNDQRGSWSSRAIPSQQPKSWSRLANVPSISLSSPMYQPSVLSSSNWQSNPSSISTVNSFADSTFSISSDVSTTSYTSNRSLNSNDAHYNTRVGIDKNAIQILYRAPPKPMLVLFVQNRATKRLNIVSVDIDGDTQINPNRCNCRRSGRDGASCPIASIEQSQGRQGLSVRRFESRDGDMGCNLAQLALERREERQYANAAWRDVQRISIMFPNPGDRAKFGGTSNICHCEPRLLNCFKAGHKGHFGLVKEFGRQQIEEYHQARRSTHNAVGRDKAPRDGAKSQDDRGTHPDEIKISDLTIEPVFEQAGATDNVSGISKPLRDSMSPKMDMIARKILQTLERVRQRKCENCPPGRTDTRPGPELCQNHVHPFSITLDTDWRPLEYLNTQFDGKPPKIGSVVTFTGRVSSAFATACSEYLKATWPRSGSELLVVLDMAIREAKSNGPYKEAEVRSSQKGIFTKPSLKLYLSRQGNLVVQAEGTGAMLVELTQQIAWLSSALRSSPQSENNASHYYCDTTLALVDTNRDRASKIETAAFILTSRFEEVLSSKYSCWLDLISCDTVIARHFPIPQRCGGKGLEIPLPILVEMAGVRHVVDFKGGVVMKGMSSMLLPVSRTEDIIQLHLVSAPPDVERLTYQCGLDLCENRALSEEVPLESIAKSRLVVGWCSHAVSKLGDEDMAYDNIDYSTANESPSAVNISSIALGVQQIGMGQIEFTVGAKNPRSHFKREGTYSHLLNVASRMKVLLYDTCEKRAWLVGADEVILHIIRKRHSVDPFFSEGHEVRITTAGTAKQTLLSNRKLVLLEDDERPETLRDMVSRVFSLLEFLIDENVMRDRSPDMTVSTSLGFELAGYEFMAVTEEHSPYHRKQCKISKTSGGWTSLVEACDALVLFASGFEDLIRPVEGARDLCHKYETMPKDKDYLGTKVELLLDLYNVAGCRLSRELLTRSGLCWHCDALLFEPCMSPGSFQCRCKRLQRIVSKPSFGTIESPGPLDEKGAVIFGKASERNSISFRVNREKGKATLYRQANIALNSPSVSFDSTDEGSTCSEISSEDNIYDTADSSVSSSGKSGTCSQNTPSKT